MTLSEYRSLRKRMRVAAFTLFAFVAGFAAGAAPGFTGCTQQDLTPVPDTSALCPAAAAFADNAGSAQPEKWVCLTFDDGPSRTTPAVLAALDAAGETQIPDAFCIHIGDNALLQQCNVRPVGFAAAIDVAVLVGGGM